MARSLISAALVPLAVSGAITVIISAGRGEGAFSLSFAISLAYCLMIGVPASVIFGRIGPRLDRRSALQQWLVYVGIVIALTVAATFAIRGTLVAIGAMSVDAMWGGMLASVEISAAIGIPCTIGAMTYGRLRTRAGKAEQRATEARLASLESRVRPHFLFNALNSAIALIPEEPKRAEAVLEALAALLRFSLNAQGMVTLREELRIVTDYLEIERARFGDRLRYTLDVPAELDEHAVPAFAIQTLVENSVKYAVSARSQGATISVRARMADVLTVTVRDDGPGFTEAPWVPGHGLDSLRARLVALYGERARLVVPPPGAGPTITLEVP